MKKYSRLYWAALLLICTLIPFLFFGKLQKSEALRFFESFVDPSELVIDKSGLVRFREKESFPKGEGLPLKYADQLEFKSYKKLSIDNITINPHGEMLIDVIVDPKSAMFYTEGGYRLLKFMDGVWYEISQQDHGLERPQFSPNSTTQLRYCMLIFLRIHHGQFYTLPSGHYYLFISTTAPTEDAGIITGHGAAMIEIELVNLDGETKRFTEVPKIDTYPYSVDMDAFPKYSVKVLGETLYHDPYA